MRTRAWLLGLASVLAWSAGLAPSANALVYFGLESDVGEGSSIARANLDGTNVSRSFITAVGSPSRVAVNRTHIYWINGSFVGRARLDGSDPDPRFLSVGADAGGLAVSESHLFWSNVSANSIGRVNVDGSGANPSFITGANQPLGVAVHGSHVYWTNNAETNASLGTIGRADLDGTGVDQNFITGATGPSALTVNATHVYWIHRPAEGRIGRASIDGTGANQSFISDTGFNGTGLGTSASHIYWVDEGSIGRARLDGTAPNRRFISRGEPNARGLAVDGLTRPPGPSPPIAGRTVNAAVVRGVVSVRRRGQRGFRRLIGQAQIPVGSEVDTRRGQVRLTSAADRSGRTQTGDFYDGRFVVRQARSGRPVTELALSEPLTCPRRARARAAARSRRLWGKGRGRFRTRGRHAAATVRGTTWLTQDTCASTTVRVTEGSVNVRDFVRRRNVIVRAGRSYTARRR